MAPQPERPDLSSAQERAVRDLLADARHTGPVPDDVAARLDATLAGLAAERAAGPTSSTTPDGTDDPPEAGPDAAVVPLARRRRIGLVLAAAAAVVVGGVAVTQVVPQLSGEDASTTSEAGGGAALDAGAGQDRAGAPQEGGVSAVSRIPRLSTDSFRRDVLRARRLAERGVPQEAAASDARGVEGRAESKADRDRTTAGRSLLTAQALAEQCGIDAGPGRLVVVRFSGRRAVLVLRPPQGDRQQADLFSCGATEPLRSVVLPVR